MPPRRNGARSRASGRRSNVGWLVAANLAFVGALIGWCDARADEATDDGAPPAVTPYRPTVTTPATLSVPGWLEGEVGVLHVFQSATGASATPRSSVPYTIKYASTPDWGVRLGGEALVRARADDASHPVGFGDTSLIVKRRFAIDDGSALGLEAGLAVPTARHALQLGSGKPDWSVNGIYSADIERFHVDLNVIETRLGGFDPDTSRWQTLAAFAASRPVSECWALVGEFSGTTQRGVAGTAQFLAGTTLTPRRDIVFDFGAIRGLNRATAHWQLFAGMTVLLGHVR